MVRLPCQPYENNLSFCPWNYVLGINENLLDRSSLNLVLCTQLSYKKTDHNLENSSVDVRISSETSYILYVYFFLSGFFFHMTFTIHRTAGETEAIFNVSLTFQPAWRKLKSKQFICRKEMSHWHEKPSTKVITKKNPTMTSWCQKMMLYLIFGNLTAEPLGVWMLVAHQWKSLYSMFV